MKKNILCLLFGFMTFFSYSQVGLVENFDAGLVLPAGWSTDAGDYFGAVVQVCDGFSQRVNLFDNNTTAHLTSPNIIGLSNGTDLTIAFDYKIVDWSAGTDATPPGWGELLVQYSTNDGGVWTTIGTVNDMNHVTSADCANISFVVPAASVPTSSDFKLRIEGNWGGAFAGTYWVYLDNISATQVVVDPPSCVNLINPTNNSTGVGINSDLEWSAATGIPTGYTVSVGTTPGGTEVVNNENVGLSTTYDLPVLEYSTQYYVTISPFNANGPALNCPEFTFTTGADPNAPVDCSAGIPINTVYCYTDFETTTWNFQSSDGGPLNVFFNAGELEACCDQVTIYDGTDNTGVVLYDGNNGGDMTGESINSTTGFIFIEIDSDVSFNCQGNQLIPLDFDVSCIDLTAVPNCNSNLATPLNGEIAVNVNTPLTWTAASIIVTGYLISIGTTPGGTDIADNVDVGNATNFATGTLLYETTYYVTIIPYNANGLASGCSEQSFTTQNDPNQVVDCSIGEVVNTVFCYENNDTMEFNFASSDGSPLVVVFNSGETENNFDELVITDSDGTVIYSDYGNNGDLTGLVFTSTGSTITVGVTSDGSVISCDDDPVTSPWNFDVSCVDVTALPNCNAALTAPLNGAIDVNENDDLFWNPATIFVTGYFISIGTTPGATDIADNVDIGNVLTYDPGTLAFATTFYVTITPYNDNGPATGCIEESFTTRNDPNQILDCSTNESINTVYCYFNNDTMEFNFASNDGSQLGVVFNSGSTENNFDELVITDSDGTVIYNAYGNNGDLTGLIFISSGDSITVGVTADGIIVNCGNDPWDFDVFCFDALAPPNCTSALTGPTDGAIDVDINADINWNPSGILVTGYTISIGTTPGGTDIADNVDVGDVLTYDPGTLTNATNYYVTITPYNDNGPATGCIEQTFKTICIPQEVNFNAIGDCDTDPDNPDFVIEVNITDLIGSASIIVSDDQGSADQVTTVAGIVTMGPYVANTVVTITTIKSDDDTCDVVSSPLTFICPPPPNPCSIVYAGEDISVDCADPTTDLSAVFHLFGQDPDTYIINGLDACPLPSTVGGTGTSIQTDDIWSEVLSIGFEFCFFGDVYDELLIGSNGVISFELENAETGNGWNMDPGDVLPNNTNPTLAEANIFGVGHDIDPGVCGDINYLVIGSAPYRMFVVNFTNVCHFQCNDIESSSQIILYESSNNIDVNVFDKPTCATWNDGNAVIGVQNIDGTVAFTPPARNTGVWTATDESWRFAPAAGTPNYVFEWFDGATSLGNSETISVTPTAPTTYTATVTYELCTGGTATVQDEVFVDFTGGAIVTPEPADLVVCDDDNDGFAEFDLCSQDVVILDGQTGLTITYHDNQPDSETGNAPLTCLYTNTGSPQTIYVRIEDDSTGCFKLSTFDLIVNPTPIANQPSNMDVCDDDGFNEFDLCSQDATVLNGQTGVTVTYHETATDADSGTSPLTCLFTNTTSGGQDIFVRVEDDATECYSTTFFEVIVNPLPVANQPTDLMECDPDDDGVAEFDLSAQTASIVLDQNNAIVTYHDSQIDADNNDDALPSIYENTSDPQTIYVRVEDSETGCFNTTSFEISIGGTNPDTSFDPNIVYEICPNATTPIDVTAIANNYSTADVSIVWYQDGSVVSGENDLTIPVLVAGFYEIEVTFTATGCFAMESVNVIESDNCIIPQVITPNNDQYNDSFDLSSFDVQSLEIFNRHGVKVYSKMNYTNDWFGQSDNGDELPVGTYFYVMKYEGSKVRTSWVYIEK